MVYDENIRYNFYDLDSRGDVKLAALLRYINLGAGQNAQDIGIGFDTTMSMGLAFVIQRFSLKINRWPAFQEEARIRTWPAEITKGTYRRNGDMYDAKGDKLAEWTGQWVLIDINERKVKRPKALPISFQNYGAMDVTIENIKPEPPQDGTSIAAYKHIARYSEMDVNEHMNNAVYGELIANVLELSGSPYKKVLCFKEVHFNYLNETRLGEEIDVEALQGDKSLYFSGKVGDKMVFATSIKTG